MCYNCDDFIDEGRIARYLSIPFMHEVTEYDSNESIQL